MEKTVRDGAASVKENRMGTQPIGRLLFSMALPLAFSMLIQSLYNVVDSIFVSRISESALAAVSLANPIHILMVSFGVGTSMGINSLISRRLGAKRFNDANAAAVNGLFVLLLTYIVFLLFGFFGAGPFIRAYTQDPEITEMGTSYLRIYCRLSVGLFMALGGERIMQAQGKPVYSMIMQAVGAVTNLILDPILIFGLLGMPKLGVDGAAIATVTGQWFSMILAFIIIAGKKNDLKISFRRFKPSARIIRDIYIVGAPSIVMQGVTTVMSVLLNGILIGFSSTAVAVFGAYYKVQGFLLMPMNGMMNASVSIEAYSFGARSRVRLMRTWRRAMITGMIIMLLGTSMIWLFSREIMALFGASEEMMRLGVAALRTTSSGLVLAAVSISIASLCQAIGRGTYSMMISLMRLLILLLPVAWILARTVGQVSAVWFAFPIAEVVALFFSLFILARVYRREIKPLDMPPLA